MEILIVILLAVILAVCIVHLSLFLRARPRSVQADHRREYKKRAAEREKRKAAIRKRAMREQR